MPDTRTKETVVVVHGTFSAQAEDGNPRWYQPGQNFCRQLDAELQSAGSVARCWAHLQPPQEHFYWDGANDWLSRQRAATRLRLQIRTLIADGWQVHLVGHSHGGNVIFQAITDRQGQVEAWFTGRVALLGTPLYRPSTAKYKRQERLRTRWWALSLVIWPALLALSAGQVDPLAAFGFGAATERWAMFVALVLMVAVAVLLVRALGYWQFRSPLLASWPLELLPWRGSPSLGRLRRSPAFLLINSDSDEAYRSLSALPHGPNPLRATGEHPSWTAATILGAVFSVGRRRLALRVGGAVESSRPGVVAATGAGAVAALLLWQPLLTRVIPGPLPAEAISLAFWIVVTAVLIGACALDRFLLLPGIVATETLPALWAGLMGYAVLAFDTAIRRGVWESIKSLSLGLNGAPERVTDIDVRRAFSSFDAEDCVYLELPEFIVARVVDAQKRRFGEIQEILYRKGTAWSPAGLREALEGANFPLVHTAYYQEPNCVRKVAAWIAEEVVVESDGSTKMLTIVPRGEPRNGLQDMVGEEIEGVNHYRRHVEQLRAKFTSPAGEWELRTAGEAQGAGSQSAGA